MPVNVSESVVVDDEERSRKGAAAATVGSVNKLQILFDLAGAITKKGLLLQQFFIAFFPRAHKRLSNSARLYVSAQV